jgi:hypothetical protein
LVELIRHHVLAAARIHGDDTTVPVLAKGKTDIARLWTYVRDDRPFGGQDPPAAMFFYSRDRVAAHPVGHLASYSGILQADAYAGFNSLYDPTKDRLNFTSRSQIGISRRQATGICTSRSRPSRLMVSPSHPALRWRYRRPKHQLVDHPRTAEQSRLKQWLTLVRRSKFRSQENRTMLCS